MHLCLLSSPDTAGTGVFRVRLPQPIPTSSSGALRTPPPDTGVPDVVSVPISAPDWPDLCPALRIAGPEPHQQVLYNALGVPHLPGKTEKTLIDPRAEVSQM